MTATIAHVVPQLGIGGVSGGNTQAIVSLPAPPWGTLDRDDRRDTAPRAARITGARTIQADPLLRGTYRTRGWS